MDSLPKKRKLVEFGTNISPPKGQSFTKPSYILGENKYKASSKLRKKIKQEPISEDEDSINVQVKKSPQELIKSEQTVEDDIKCPDIKNLQKNLIFEDSRHGEFIWGNDRKEVVWFSTDYIEDIITHEIFKESLYRLSENFCKVYDINPTGREILIDWLISVQIHLKADNSTLHLAVALLDIVLDKVHIPLNELQAAAAAAFWVAYKFIHGSIGMKTLLSLCAGSVTKTMIEDNEILVLQTSCLIQAGGSLTVFFNYLLYKIFGFKFPPEIYYCGLYFMEIMLLQFVFVDCPAHEKATTAVFTSLTAFNCSSLLDPVDVSRFISKRKLLNVYRRLMRSLKLMYNDRDTLKNSNVYKKYKSSRYYKISVHQNVLKCLANVL